MIAFDHLCSSFKIVKWLFNTQRIAISIFIIIVGDHIPTLFILLTLPRLTEQHYVWWQYLENDNFWHYIQRYCVSPV